VDDFLRDLRAKGAGDLNAVLTTLNEAGLCRETVRYWLEQGWIVISPSSPLSALAGPLFSREISLHQFCGEPAEALPVEDLEPETEEPGSDEHP